MPRTNPTISVTIRPDQKAWLKDHPINVSGLLQQALDIYMKRDEAWREKVAASLKTATL